MTAYRCLGYRQAPDLDPEDAQARLEQVYRVLIAHALQQRAREAQMEQPPEEDQLTA